MRFWHILVRHEGTSFGLSSADGADVEASASCRITLYALGATPPASSSRRPVCFLSSLRCFVDFLPTSSTALMSARNFIMHPVEVRGGGRVRSECERPRLSRRC
eukprot:1545062-Rhodomonas_salina.2